MFIESARKAGIRTYDAARDYAEEAQKEVVQGKKGPQRDLGEVAGEDWAQSADLVDVVAQRQMLRDHLKNAVEAQRREALRPISVQELEGEFIDRAQREEIAASIGETRGAAKDKLDLAYDRNEDFRGQLTAAARRIATGDSTLARETADLLGPTLELLKRPLAEIIGGRPASDTGGVQVGGRAPGAGAEGPGGVSGQPEKPAAPEGVEPEPDYRTPDDATARLFGEEPAKETRFATRKLIEDEDIPDREFRTYALLRRPLPKIEGARERGLERLEFSDPENPFGYARIPKDREPLTPEEMAQMGMLEADPPGPAKSQPAGSYWINPANGDVYRAAGFGDWRRYIDPDWGMAERFPQEQTQRWAPLTKNNVQAMRLQGYAMRDPTGRKPEPMQKTLFATRGPSEEELRAKPDVEITRLTGRELTKSENLDTLRSAATAAIAKLRAGPLHNDDTGWDLVINRKDARKIARDPQQTQAELRMVGGLADITRRAVLAESYADTRGGSDVTAVHRLYAPVALRGKLYRAKLTVLDLNVGDRKLHALSAVELDGPEAITPSHEGAVASAAQRGPQEPSRISIAQLLEGAARQDGTPVLGSEPRFATAREKDLEQPDIRLAEDEVPGDPGPKLHPSIAYVKAIRNDVVGFLNPAHVGPESERAAQIMRASAGQQAADWARAREVLGSYHKRFARADSDETVRKQALDFIDRMERGVPQERADDEALAVEIRNAFDRRVKEVQRYGRLADPIANYFPHIWKDPKAAKEFYAGWFGKRPIEGPKSYLKQRSIPTVAEGIAGGLEPVSYNPVDLTLLKIREMDRWLFAQRVKEQLGAEGLAKFVYATSRAPEGWRKVEDSAFTVYGGTKIPVFEAYDGVVVKKLNDFIEKMGWTHERKVKIGGKRLGYASRLEGIVTKFGGPESVIMHELGHQLDYRYDLWDRLAADTKPNARGGIAQEFRDLADLTMGPKWWRRRKEEKLAITIGAYLYAPAELRRAAPTVMDRLESFLDAHPELHDLKSIKPSLQLPTPHVDEADVGGLIVRGHWYLPERAAAVVNNYLSPGYHGKPIYDLLRYPGNLLNQAQLGMSAFHLLFTSLDAVSSSVSLAAKLLADGKPLAAAKKAAAAPLAPYYTIRKGSGLIVAPR